MEASPKLALEIGDLKPFVVSHAPSEVLFRSVPVDFIPIRIARLLHANSQTSIWIAGTHVVADTHYDTSNNFYIPIYGEKIFHLLPPQRIDSLHVYPSLHSHYRQARGNIFASPTPPLEVVIAPGDILFLPPYWFHRVSQKVRHTS